MRFALPDVGEGLHEAEILRWLVAEGDTVARDQPLVEILTDKAQVELPSPVAGVVHAVAVAEGAIVEVGTVLIEIDDGSPRPAPAGIHHPAARSARIDNESAKSPESGRIDADSTLVAGGLARPKASPSTRRRAARLGIDLGRVRGSGPGGRILDANLDAEAAATAGPTSDAPAPPPPVAAAIGTPSRHPRPAPEGDLARSPVSGLGQLPFGTHPLRGIRRLTAAAMTLSWSTIPHITGMDELDATALLDARQRLRQALSDDGQEAAAAALTPLVLLAAAVAASLRRFPLVNASVNHDGSALTVYEQVNLGIAVATPDGLIVPVVTDADRRDLVSLALEMQRLALAARQRSVSTAELRGGTFTLTNYGALGGRFATPLILPGQAGIMGFGAIKERPVAQGGVVVARPTLPVVFSADHRIIDGDLSVAFQEAVLAIVADPLRLLLGA